MLNSIETIALRLTLAVRCEEWSDEFGTFMPTDESRRQAAEIRRDLAAISEMAPTSRFDVEPGEWPDIE